MPMTIRDEARADYSAVEALAERAFGGPGEARLVARLREDGDAAISLVGDEDGRIVGHVLFSPLRAPMRALALAPVAVAPERQRQGLGSALVREGLARARSEGWRAVFVLGEPAYYGRFGFSAALARGFESVYAGPYLQAIALGERLPVMHGRIDHAPAFAALG